MWWGGKGWVWCSLSMQCSDWVLSLCLGSDWCTCVACRVPFSTMKIPVVDVGGYISEQCLLTHGDPVVSSYSRLPWLHTCDCM